MHLEEVVLGYENCDSLVIDGRHVKGIYMDGVKESYVGFGDGKINLRRCVETFVLFISRKANKKVAGYELGVSSYEDEFSRLHVGNDITGVSIKLCSDGSDETAKKWYGVTYIGTPESYGHCNGAQKSYIGKDGDLCLVISKDKNIEDFFDIYDDSDEEDDGYPKKGEVISFHI